MTYGYIRVSSDKQTVENQRFEIIRFCGQRNIKIDGWINETISGTKHYSKRLLGELLKDVGKDDIIICSELSRLGRSLFMIMEILNVCMTKECRVWTVKDNYRLGEDIQSKVLAFAFGLSAEIERNLISQRTKEALLRKRSEGAVLGRPKGRGSKKKSYKLSAAEKTVRKMRLESKSYYKISRALNVHPLTAKRFCQAFVNDMPDFSADSVAAKVEQLLAVPSICPPRLPVAALPAKSRTRS
jgi:DNA invertase Pin-like site-specific DNA recombinase